MVQVEGVGGLAALALVLQLPQLEVELLAVEKLELGEQLEVEH
jgi:hypothetical protein